MVDVALLMADYNLATIPEGMAPPRAPGSS
jgi:hypothetical protein